MLPHQLVGVAVRRIGRQKEQAQFPAQRLHESADFLRAMSRATIDDQEDFALMGARLRARRFKENTSETRESIEIKVESAPDAAAAAKVQLKILDAVHARFDAGRLRRFLAPVP